MKQKKCKNEWNFRENMKIIILLSSIALVSAASVEPSPRSVNVALETSFLFEPKDINDNISFIKNIKVFLDKLYKILAPQAKPPPEQHLRTEDRRFSFKDFITNVGESFLNFTGTKLEDAVKVLHIEVNKIADKSKSTYHEIIPEEEIKSYVKESVKQWATTDPNALKHNIRRMMNENNQLLHAFARRMNNYYNEDDVKKLLKIHRKFNRYLENKMDASKVVKELLHFGILNKYKKLNETARANLMDDLKMLSEFVTTNKKFKFKVQGNNKQPSISKRNNPPAFELLISDSENVSHEPNKTEQGNILSELKKAIGKLKITTSAKANDDGKKKAVATNEIVVDNVELIVESLKKLSR